MNIWDEIQNEVKLRIEAEPSLEPYLNQLILSQDNLINSVAAVLASKLFKNVFFKRGKSVNQGQVIIEP